LRTVDGETFVFSESADVPAIWGTDARVLWAQGEPMMLAGPDGVGKTTLAQQLVRARLGLSTDLLGLAVEPAAEPVLYIAADRPRQAARSFRRMTSDEDREILAERLIVWKGPLPFDLTSAPSALANFALELGVGTIFVDSLKDVALDLTKDEVGTRVNQAHQHVIAAGLELCDLHHQRKEMTGAAKPKRLADVYGSRWIVAGMGSVVLLWGEPGDLVVELLHLKQPAEDVGPLKVVHDHVRGRSSVHEGIDFEKLLAAASHGMTAKDGARAMSGVDPPTPNQVEKARRRLEKLIAQNHAERRDDPDGLARYFLRSQPS
jgi:replicative DNA helicase